MKKGVFFTAFKVFRERGFVSFLRRFYEYAVASIRAFLFYRFGDVLYVSGCPGGSFRYRCENQAEEVRKYGLRTFAVSQNDRALMDLVDNFDSFVFHRTIFDDYLSKVVEKIKKQGKTIIFETDDLVFDPEFLPFMHYYNSMGDEERAWYENGIGRELLGDPYVKHCVVSTEYLAEKVREKYPDKKVFISFNKMGKDQVRWSQKAISRGVQKDKDVIRLGYFSGSKSHDADFASIGDVLLEILKEYENTRLVLVGFLDLDERFSSFEHRIERIEFMSLKKLPEVIARVDIQLAPLEMDNPFCHAKSALKYFEAGILGVPTVASATDSFSRVIRHGETGMLAGTYEEWYDALRSLVSDPILRDRIGKDAKKDAFARHVVRRSDDENASFPLFLVGLKRGRGGSKKTFLG